MSRLVNVAEVAERLGVSPITVSRIAQRGEIPSVLVAPRSLRFDERDVEEFIAARTRNPK